MSSTRNVLYLVNLYLHVLYQTIISYDIYLYISTHILSYTFVLLYTFYTFHVFIFHAIAYCFSCSITYSLIICTFIYFIYFSCVHLPCYSLLFFMFYYIFFHILFMSSYSVILVLVTVYYHRITMLCFSYHIISYTLHIHFPYIYFSFSFMFMPANTLEADTRNK